MRADLIYIAPGLTFADLRDGTITKPDVLRAELNEWLFRPLHVLGKVSAGKFGDMGCGMAMLLLELTFFEHHGQYITGKDSDINADPPVKISSTDAFIAGFNALRQYLVDIGRGTPDLASLDAKSLYKFGRCGLFHSFNLRWEFLVDARQVSASFERNTHPDVGGWLINPWRMREDLESYASSYIDALATLSHPWHQPGHAMYAADLRQSFLTTFDRIHPLALYT
jgi:hypothetical protein